MFNKTVISYYVMYKKLIMLCDNLDDEAIVNIMQHIRIINFSHRKLLKSGMSTQWN